jgi:hypothetical protein
MKQIKENLEWIADTDASVDLERAMSLLQDELAT